MTAKIIYYRDAPGRDVFQEVLRGQTFPVVEVADEKGPVSIDPGPPSALTSLLMDTFEHNRKTDLERADQIAQLKESVEFWKAEAAALLKQLEEERCANMGRR